MANFLAGKAGFSLSSWNPPAETSSRPVYQAGRPVCPAVPGCVDQLEPATSILNQLRPESFQAGQASVKLVLGGGFKPDHLKPA